LEAKEMTKKKKKKAKKKSKSKHYTALEKHRRKGKKLVPPLLDVPNLSLASWANDRLPEMLWAALLLTQTSRSKALGVFKEIGRFITRQPDKKLFSDVSHTALSKLEPEKALELMVLIASKTPQRKALLPLLLFDSLPARELWSRALAPADDSLDWEVLMHAVARTLEHQSQEATDLRWLRIYTLIVAGMFMLPSQEMAKEFLYYPDYGDMRKVQPSIRASEGAMSLADKTETDWPKDFWRECVEKTPCFPLNLDRAGHETEEPHTTVEQLVKVYNKLIDHNHLTIGHTAVDARHDTVFGTAFYCLTLLSELLKPNNSTSIAGRTLLRTITECYITLSYLAKKEDDQLWQSYRVYGTGQAKLAFLKLEELEEPPPYVSLDTLKTLANEDMWQEYVPIDLGHWEKSNLRKMSQEANVKNEYDKYYSWTSTFAHGHWGAVRDTVLDTCANPLHRLHRIPRTVIHRLPDVIPDACYLIDKILRLVSDCYPDFPERVTLVDSYEN
jgi:hypothetical protein